ncbi:MAG TPA: rod shape-determining protein MreD [Bacteroidetes bacterium]|nr:rod shape-determining protein MreD [Bacteroidota bacterium]
MRHLYVRNIVRYLSLVLFQVLILNHMNLSGYINPYIYILFILLLPVRINKSMLLLFAFLTGLTIDYLGNTLGLHAAATVFMAFLRPSVIKVFFNNVEFLSGDEPGIAKIKTGGFLKYSLVLVFVHHSVLFFLEIFDFHDFLNTLSRTVLSTLVTTAMIMIIVLVFTPVKRKK